MLAALPILEFLLGRFVTHAMESRYALGSVIAISALAPLALDPLLRRPVAGSLILLVLFASVAAKGILNIRTQRQERNAQEASMVMTPEVRAAILASPSKLLYTQDIQAFGFLLFHDPDATTTAHLALVYSKEREMRFNGSAVSALVSSNLKTFTPYTILRFEDIENESGDHIFVVSEGGWNWAKTEFAKNRMEVKPIGKLLGRDVVSVRFPAQRPSALFSPMP